MDVAEYPKISHFCAIESEKRRPVPPHMPSSRPTTEQFAAVISVVAELAKHLVAFLHHIENVGSVLAQSANHHVDVTGKLFVPTKFRTERAAEVKSGWNIFGIRLLSPLSHISLKKTRTTSF
jgi:hypothetical protein